jgi:HAE1 family hydrophobic/amphiphilic exporter-1
VNSLSEFSIRRPFAVLMIICALIIFGLISLPRMAVELYPDINIPVAVVVTSVDGETPTEVEKLVTKPIESALGSVENLKKLQSSSTEGASLVIVQFNWGTNMEQALQDIRDKVDLVRGQLPDTAKSPRIMKFDPNSMPIITLALTGDGDLSQIKTLAEKTIQPKLEQINGVASVSISGAQDREIDIVLDPHKLEAYGLTIDQIQQAIAATNQSGSAGSIRQGSNKLNIRVQGEFQTVQGFGQTPIAVKGGYIRLQDIATIQDTYKEESQKTYFNGKPSLTLSVYKASGGNTVQIADQVNSAIKKLQGQLPRYAKLAVTLDASTYIKDSIHTVENHALIGGLFAVLMLFVFLNSFRSMLIVSIVIPISVTATFMLMYFTGQTINMFTLGGLTLGLGSLVDFAVVILENIFRLRQEGKGLLEAAKLGSSQVGSAVMASALAQISVFLPIVFVQGLSSQLFGPLALTVVFSHVAALIVSVMLVPMLGSRWLQKVPDEAYYRDIVYRGWNPIVWFQIAFAKVSKLYGKMLAFALTHRKTVIFATIGLFVFAILLSPMVGMEFLPKMDQGKITVSIKTPSGTMLSETESITRQVESFVKKIPELDSYSTSIGSTGSQSLQAAKSNQSQISISLVDKTNRKRSTEQVVEALRKDVAMIPGAKIEVTEQDNTGASQGSPLQIDITGDDLAILQDISNVIADQVKKIPGTRNVKTSLDDIVQEFDVQIDANKASVYHLNTMQILSAIRTGFYGQTVTKYRTGEDEIDVNLRFPKSYQDNMALLTHYNITNPLGESVPLSSVATIHKVDVPQSIQRSDQKRDVQVTSDITGRDLGSVSNDVQKILDSITLPDGYHYEIGGQSKDMAEAFGSLGYAILLSIVLVYMVMVAQFESLFNPFIIMFSIPPTFIGVVIGLFLTRNSLSVSALIGYILLIGIVVNNAIVLIDFVNTLRKEGMERNAALLKAGPIRLRPILMTTFATILAVLPLAFGGGTGNEDQAPMAVVVAFGLSFSTLITLILVPVVYTLFDDWIGKLTRRNKKRIDNPMITKSM